MLLAVVILIVVYKGKIHAVYDLRVLSVLDLYREDTGRVLGVVKAAALCDGSADKLVDVLLRLNGYGKNVDRQEFLRQALDLKDFVNSSKSNRLLEQMLVRNTSHPLLATRAYECYEWTQSAQYSGILDWKLPFESFNDALLYLT